VIAYSFLQPIQPEGALTMQFLVTAKFQNFNIVTNNVGPDLTPHLTCESKTIQRQSKHIINVAMRDSYE